MPVEKGDFVEIEYTGRLKENNQVFDTTKADVAKEADIFNENARYEPVIICVGENQIVKGVDEALIGKEAGNFTIDLVPEKAFGRKDPSQIQMIPGAKFRDQKIQPFPGLQLNVDGRLGTVKIVAGGRIMVDFNHPLSGKPVSYEVSLKRIVKETKEKIEAVLKMFSLIGEISVTENKATITMMQQLPDQVTNPLKETIKRLVKLDEVTFTVKETKPETKST